MSPVVYFKGTTKLGPFWELIIQGKKTQTIRKPRKRPFKVGDTLYLYWDRWTPKAKKTVHLIAEAPCISVRHVRLNNLWSDWENARADGFINISEFRDWFYPDWRNISSYPRLIDELYKIELTVVGWGELTNLRGLFNPEDIEGIAAFL